MTSRVTKVSQRLRIEWPQRFNLFKFRYSFQGLFCSRDESSKVTQNLFILGYGFKPRKIFNVKQNGISPSEGQAESV